MQFWTVEEMTGDPVEIEPGVTLERRTVLRMAFFAGAAVLTGCASADPEAAAARSVEAEEPLEPDALTPGEFLHRVRPEARALIATEQPDEDAYLAMAATLLSRVEPEPLWRPIHKRNGFGMGTVAYFPPVVLYDIRMDPNAVISLHDHRHYNGVLQCLEGSIRCRNFDIVAPDDAPLDVAAGEVPPKGEDFVIRQTLDQVLRARMHSTLSRDRDNIHHVEAGPDGARLIDLFTHFRPDARSYAVAWDGKPFDEANQLYRVAWS